MFVPPGECVCECANGVPTAIVLLCQAAACVRRSFMLDVKTAKVKKDKNLQCKLMAA